MEISSYLRSHARTLPGKSQLIISAFSKALEVIPRTICNNAGLDATDVLNKLRMLHARGETWAGVSVDDDSGNLGDDGKWGEGVRNNLEAFVWEPALVKVNALEGATEAACMVLSVDETVTNPSSQVSSSSIFPLSPILYSRMTPSLKATTRTSWTRRYGRRTWTWTWKINVYLSLSLHPLFCRFPSLPTLQPPSHSSSFFPTSLSPTTPPQNTSNFVSLFDITCKTNEFIDITSFGCFQLSLIH